jgi:hypothetical protein
VGSMQKSPTLLILRCRARHCWERHSLTHTCSERASLQCTDGRKPMGARLVPQSLTRTLPCGEDFFCFLPASRAPVRSTPDFL